MTTELILDGMPEPPPRWVRPDHGVRLSALDLDHMLQAALPHAGTDEEIPALVCLHLQVLDGLLQITATDRYTLYRERRPVSQTCEPWVFLLRSSDARSLRMLLANLLRGLKDEQRADEPVDILVEDGPDGALLGVLGDDLDVRFTDHLTEAGTYPSTEQLLDRILGPLDRGFGTLDVCLNPTLVARAKAMQDAGRKKHTFRWRSAKPKNSPVLIATDDEADDALIVVMPVREVDAP